MQKQWYKCFSRKLTLYNGTFSSVLQTRVVMQLRNANDSQSAHLGVAVLLWWRRIGERLQVDALAWLVATCRQTQQWDMQTGVNIQVRTFQEANWNRSITCWYLLTSGHRINMFYIDNQLRNAEVVCLSSQTST